MDVATPHPDQLVHIRIMLGVIMGLSLTRLLSGLARFVQHPGREPIYLVHLGWIIFLLSAVIHFWWFQFYLHNVSRWSFGLYLFLLCYSALYYFTCTLLCPDNTQEYVSFADYFHSRQKWFYGLLALLFAVDVVDTLWKGIDHFHELGTLYLVRQSMVIVLALLAMFIKHRAFHYAFVALILIVQVYWIVQYYEFLS
ncbi:hypothetical protein [Pollutimonas harenae]|uniref:Uncharacterized protein n=1 Tax=Pollutimonas harenae TaxID=657015 RepID=A0A853GZU3_9BURK|nr:hypothetical protein [Pollutimonas harenae]NYT85622.1 hypothetical protein [Pollutimonas harenae]TEA70700.1 hypothetical protein ERD84_08475 [Pollutimonas harenae]